MSIDIRKVTRRDVPGLLRLIRELARFERLEHEVQATAESLRKSLFGPRPAAGALIARRNGQLAGYAIYFFTFSSFVGRAGIWLEDVYVRPACRHQGLGRALIVAVARIGAERNCGRFEWSALNWNKNALEFYRKLGTRVMDEWVMLRLDAEGLRRLAESPKPEVRSPKSTRLRREAPAFARKLRRGKKSKAQGSKSFDKLAGQKGAVERFAAGAVE